MQTDDLIATLSGNLAPVRSGLVMRRLGLGLVIGLAGTFLLLRMILSLRPDLAVALAGGAFWMKFAYTFAIAGLGLWIVERQSRAGAGARVPGWLLAVPLLALAAAAVPGVAPGADRHALMMGHTARVCSVLILSRCPCRFSRVFSGPCANWPRPAGDCGRRRRHPGRRGSRDALWFSLPGDGGALHSDLVHAGHCSGGRPGRGSGPLGAALVIGRFIRPACRGRPVSQARSV